jgi:hypothetical protein
MPSKESLNSDGQQFTNINKTKESLNSDGQQFTNINKTITSKHINDALSVVTPRIDSKLIKFYHDYHLQSGLNAI